MDYRVKLCKNKTINEKKKFDLQLQTTTTTLQAPDVWPINHQWLEGLIFVRGPIPLNFGQCCKITIYEQIIIIS